ncbi:MAG: DUF2867 domain-containing protein [Mycobacteriaceae bacterium]|nr:DUF2867 domain-containing protein [Mycobacteriaceae bacterium]
MFGFGQRLPDTAHTSQPWRIGEFTTDFRLLDVWALPTPGGPHDFPQLVRLMAGYNPSTSAWPVGLLFAARSVLGDVLGLDRPQTGLGARVGSLRERMPADLRDTARDSLSDQLPFKPLYLTDDEWALEIANQTVHGVLHLSWVPSDTGGYRGQLAVLVRPNGLLGNVYLAAIAPFRHLIVYPVMTRDIGRAWRAQVAQ